MVTKSDLHIVGVGGARGVLCLCDFLLGASILVSLIQRESSLLLLFVPFQIVRTRIQTVFAVQAPAEYNGLRLAADESRRGCAKSNEWLENSPTLGNICLCQFQRRIVFDKVNWVRPNSLPVFIWYSAWTPDETQRVYFIRFSDILRLVR